MRPSRRSRLPAAAVLLALVTGCNPGGTAPVDQAAAATADAPSTEAFPPFDSVQPPAPVDIGQAGRVIKTVVDDRGQPVLLVIDEAGALTVTRPLEESAQDGSWTNLPLAELSGRNGAATIASAAGDVLVTGYAGDDFAVARITPDGAVQSTIVAAPLGPGDATEVLPALAPDGSVLYISYRNIAGTPRLLAADPATGTVTGTADIVSALPGQSIPVDIAVSAGGQRVFVVMDVEKTRRDGTVSSTATLHRLGAGLELLGEVPLINGGAPSRAAQLIAGREGTAYVTLVVGEAGTPRAEVRLIAVPPGATAATQVTSFPGLDDVRALAVDGSEDWAYLGGLANASDPLAPTVTPLNLHTGQPRLPAVVCPRGELYDIVVPDGAAHAWATGRCLDSLFTAELWTLN